MNHDKYIGAVTAPDLTAHLDRARPRQRRDGRGGRHHGHDQRAVRAPHAKHISARAGRAQQPRRGERGGAEVRDDDGAERIERGRDH